METNENSFTWTLDDQMLEQRIDMLFLENETITAFARRCGLDPGNFQKFKAHKLHIGTTYLRRIAAACQVSIDWLELGDGERNKPNGMVNEPLNPQVQKRIFVPDELSNAILKAENQAMANVLNSVSDMMKTMQDMLEQNREALAQNRALMQFIVEHFKK